MGHIILLTILSVLFILILLSIRPLIVIGRMKRQRLRLLSLLEEEIQSDVPYDGMCSVIVYLYTQHNKINANEHDYLNYIIKLHKPINCYNEWYYFQPYNVPQRLAFIRSLKRLY